jgi:hypothetical protein
MAIERIPARLPFAVTVWIPDEREGQILGGTQTHVEATVGTCFPLRTHARRLGLDWLVQQEGEIRYPRAVYSRPQDRIGQLYPDCLVAVGVELDDSEPYDLLKIGRPPILVVEIISKKTGRKDREGKVTAYAEMGIQEYATFDPRPRKGLELRGYRLAGPGRYAAIPPAAEGGIWLGSVGLRAVGERGADRRRANRLRLYTPEGLPLLFPDEEAALRVQAERAMDEERSARLRAEQERDLAEQERGDAVARTAYLEALLAKHGIAPE